MLADLPRRSCKSRSMMKHFFQGLLLAICASTALADSNPTTKPATNASQCNVNNNYNFFSGPNCKKVEGMFSEVKQELNELKEEIKEMKENQTGGPGGKASNSTTNVSQCNVTNFNSLLENHTKKIEHMFSEVKEQLMELKEEIKELKENHSGGHCRKVYKNCAEVYKSGDKISGVYKIDPDGLGEFEVFCDQKTAGGGWTVFQKRRDGSVDFFRAWDDYKRGFGNLNGEFWLGLDKIHRLTVSSSNKLRVDLERFNGETAFAEYSSFSVANEAAKYRLSFGNYSGSAGDSLAHHRGAAFSTKDRDNDASSGSCALRNKGGWWYKSCQHANLNGLYLKGGGGFEGVRWYFWKKDNKSLKRSEMNFRLKDF